MIAWTIYVTFAGAVLLLFLPRVFSRWLALIASVAAAAISIIAFFSYKIPSAPFTTIIKLPWVPALSMNYHLAADGISLTMCLVTSITAVSAVLFSWDVRDRANEFFFWL